MNGEDAPPPARVTARTIQIGLGIIWILDGLLQLQPKMFGSMFANDVIMPSAQGQPGAVSDVITHMAHPDRGPNRCSRISSSPPSNC